MLPKPSDKPHPAGTTRTSDTACGHAGQMEGLSDLRTSAAVGTRYVTARTFPGSAIALANPDVKIEIQGYAVIASK